MENFLRYLFPPSCIFCGNFGCSVCTSCLDTCRRTQSFHLLRSTDFGFDSDRVLPVYSFFSYEWRIRECIRTSKYVSRRFVLLRDLTKYALARMPVPLFSEDTSYVVVPIPSDPQNLRRRGFNQAEVIGAVVSKAYGYPQISILHRVRTAQAQHKLSRASRFQNLKGVFSVRYAGSPPSRVLLVDDILTTGATLWLASEALYSHGVQEVISFTLSRRL